GHLPISATPAAPLAIQVPMLSFLLRWVGAFFRAPQGCLVECKHQPTRSQSREHDWLTLVGVRQQNQGFRQTGRASTNCQPLNELLSQAFYECGRVSVARGNRQ